MWVPLMDQTGLFVREVQVSDPPPPVYLVPLPVTSARIDETDAAFGLDLPVRRYRLMRTLVPGLPTPISAYFP